MVERTSNSNYFRNYLQKGTVYYIAHYNVFVHEINAGIMSY